MLRIATLPKHNHPTTLAKCQASRKQKTQPNCQSVVVQLCPAHRLTGIRACRKPDTIGPYRASRCILYGNQQLRLKWRAQGLLAMSDLGSHTTLLAANLSTSLTCSFRSHSFFLLHKAVIRCLIRALAQKSG